MALLRPIDPTSYAAAARSGRAALAWEVLRRNPAYQADYRSALEPAGSGQADGAFTARWGLHFP